MTPLLASHPSTHLLGHRPVPNAPPVLQDTSSPSRRIAFALVQASGGESRWHSPGTRFEPPSNGRATPTGRRSSGTTRDAYPESPPTPGDVARAEAARLNELGLGDECERRAGGEPGRAGSPRRPHHPRLRGSRAGHPVRDRAVHRLRVNRQSRGSRRCGRPASRPTVIGPRRSYALLTVAGTAGVNPSTITQIA